MLYDSIERILLVIVSASLVILCIVLFRILHSFNRNMMWQKRTYTQDLIDGNQDFNSSVLELIMSHEDIPPSEYSSNEELFKKIIKILNRCESISLGVRHGLYDEDIIRCAYIGGFLHLYRKYERFIYERRAKLNDPEIYVEFELYVKRLSSKKRNMGEL